MQIKIPHILIVDDDPGLLKTLSDILELKGFRPVAAQNGHMALEQLEKHSFELALLDLRLEDMSGLDVLRAIKTRSPDTECILLTGHATQKSAIEAIQMGVYGYFQKPLDMDQVLLSIQRAVEKSVAVKALRQSEEHYRAVTQTASDAIITADSAGKIVSWNRSAEIMFGYSEAEIVGQPLTLILPSHYHNEYFARTKQLQTGEEKRIFGRTIEGEGLRKDNSTFPLEFSLSEWRSGENIFHTTIIRDTTERRQIEEQLRKLSHAVDQSPASVIITDLQGNIEYINPRFTQITGYAFSEVAGKNPRLLKSGHTTQEEYKRLWDTITSGKTWQGEFLNKKKNGETFWELATIAPIFNNRGEVTNFLALKEDITDRRQAQESLQLSEERLRIALNASQIAIWDWDIKQDIWVASTNYYTMLGYEPEYGPSDRSIWLSRVHPDDREAVAKKIKNVLENRGEHYEYEARMLHVDGSYRWHRVLGNVVARDDQGNATRMLGVRMDIDEQKKAESSIQQRVTELELLYESGLAFSRLLNPKEIAQKIIELLEEKLNWHHTAIRLVSATNEENLELLAFDRHGLETQTEDVKSDQAIGSLITKSDQGLSGWALKQGRILRLGNVKKDPHYIETYPGMESGLYVPLKSGTRILGVISLESELPNAFSEEDEQLIATLASQATIAFENARLYEEILHYAEALEQHVQERTAEIESTRRRLELAVKTAGVGIWELDVRENRDLWDENMFALYGLSAGSNQPPSKARQSAVYEEDLENQKKVMVDALNHDQPYDTEFRVVWPDASIHHIKSNAVVLRGEDNQPEKMVGADQDITIHKQAEEALRLANAEMERALRMKDEFLANMSHELRTPLNAILGISESLEEQFSGSLNEKQLKYVRIINESGRHLLDLINDILDLSKIEAGKLEINIQTIPVERFCTSCLRMVKELAHKKSLEIVFKADEKVQAIKGDERRLKQTLVNLLGNAVKFTPENRKIGLEVSGNPEKNEVTFTVWDEGIGIDPKNIPLLFKPFVQLDTGLTREYAGTGLGLALVAQMVRLHGGRVNLTSKLHEGSRFMVTLPWMPIEQKNQLPHTAPLQFRSSKPNIKHTGRILVVDDTELVSQLVCDYLENMGYETLVAEDGKEAVSIAKQEHPNLILMDVMMPVMSGLDATKQIRTDPTLKDVPIIGLTAMAMPEDRQRCLDAGMNDHLGKPIQMQELAQVIERYINTHKDLSKEESQ